MFGEDEARKARLLVMRGRVATGLASCVLVLAACSAQGASTPSASAPSGSSDIPVPLSAPVDYDVGTLSLDGGSGRARLPVRGTIAFPEQLPCAKGRDARYDRGMGWLASALAARGYVAIVPDITATRDFRYESRMVPLGWELADATLARLRRAPADFGVPGGVVVSGTTVLVGHSVGGDNAMWWAAERPDDIAAVVLLEPAPSLPGLVPPPASPFAYAHEIEQIGRIPTGLPFAVALGRCDDDAGYLGGLYTIDGTADPERTAMTVTAILPTADHLMMNTRATRETDPPQAGCPEPRTAEYEATVEATRAAMADWTGDVPTVFLDPAQSNGSVARRAGIDPLAPGRIAGLPGASVIVMPPSTERTTVLLPLGGALGVDGPGGSQVSEPSAGAVDCVAYGTTRLEMHVCPAGGIVPEKAPDLVDCGLDRVERPGLGPALFLRLSSWSR